MGVDCSAVSGYGIEVTEEIADKMISSGVFTREQWENDNSDCLSKCKICYGESGSYYAGETTLYLFASGDTIPKLYEGAKEFISKLSEIGIELTIDDIKEVSDVLWS